jgi:hypothetical protein
MLSFVILIVAVTLTTAIRTASKDENIWNNMPPSTQVVTAQSNNNLLKHLLYHLDVINCSIPLPDFNQSVAYTAGVFKYFWSSSYYCIIFKHNEAPIDFEENSVFHLQSWHKNPYKPYALRVFHINCSRGGMKLLNDSTHPTNINLEGRRKIGGASVCMDYIKIKQVFTQAECVICGNDDIIEKCEFLSGTFYNGDTHLIVTFRSGPSVESKGFDIYFKCSSDLLEKGHNNKKSNENTYNHCLKLSNKKMWQHYLSSSLWNRQELIELADTFEEVPKDAMSLLFDFHDKYRKIFNKRMTGHDDMLALALIAEKSCNSAIKTLGIKVKDMFSNIEEDEYMNSLKGELQFDEMYNEIP